MTSLKHAFRVLKRLTFEYPQHMLLLRKRNSFGYTFLSIDINPFVVTVRTLKARFGEHFRFRVDRVQNLICLGQGDLFLKVTAVKNLAEAAV